MEKILDANGWPIVAGARVYVPERPGLAGGIVKGFTGVVTAVAERCVDVEEYLSFASRSIRPEQCAVQKGESKTSLEHEALRRGGTAYLRQRAKQIQQRAERLAEKVGE